MSLGAYAKVRAHLVPRTGVPCAPRSVGHVACGAVRHLHCGRIRCEAMMSILLQWQLCKGEVMPQTPNTTEVPPMDALDTHTEKVPPSDPRARVISIDPGRMSGTPCFVGTRVPIKHLWDYLKMSISNIKFQNYSKYSIKNDRIFLLH